MDCFTIAPDIATLLPTIRVVIVAAYNLTNTGNIAEVTKFAEVSLQQNPRVQQPQQQTKPSLHRKQLPKPSPPSSHTPTHNPTPALPSTAARSNNNATYLLRNFRNRTNPSIGAYSKPARPSALSTPS